MGYIRAKNELRPRKESHSIMTEWVWHYFDFLGITLLSNLQLGDSKSYGKVRELSTTFMFQVLRDSGLIKVKIGFEVDIPTLKERENARKHRSQRKEAGYDRVAPTRSWPKWARLTLLLYAPRWMDAKSHEWAAKSPEWAAKFSSRLPRIAPLPLL